jgi:hypothetical protein
MTLSGQLFVHDFPAVVYDAAKVAEILLEEFTSKF